MVNKYPFITQIIQILNMSSPIYIIIKALSQLCSGRLNEFCFFYPKTIPLDKLHVFTSIFITFIHILFGLSLSLGALLI